jgi:hypothetical protein
MQDSKITCDGCGRSITKTSNSVDYRLVLKCEAIPCNEGPVTDMMIHPEINQPHHFCGLSCLIKWVHN